MNTLKTLSLICLMSFSFAAQAGTVSACDCSYEGISGDYALILSRFSFEGKKLSSRKVGTYFAQSQCQQVAVSTYACNQVIGGSQMCDCKYDVISGDYQLTRYIADENGKTVLTQELAQYFGGSQCTNAALSLPACY